MNIMSYPAACRAYIRSRDELLLMIVSLEKSGIHVHNLVNAIDNENHKEAKEIAESRQELTELLPAIKEWKRHHELMKQGEQVVSEDISNQNYWKEYLDMLGHEQLNDKYIVHEVKF